MLRVSHRSRTNYLPVIETKHLDCPGESGKMNGSAQSSKAYQLSELNMYLYPVPDLFLLGLARSRRILRIRWEQKITNEEVHRRVQCKKNIIQQIMERNLYLFGHIYRMKDNKWVKEVMFIMIEGESCMRGRPCIEWLDDTLRVERRGNSHTQQKVAGSRHVENGGAEGIGHLWALSPQSNGWMDGIGFGGQKVISNI